MANFSLTDIFGKRATAKNIDARNGDMTLQIDIRDFQNEEEGGEIKDGLGLTNLRDKFNDFIEGKIAVQLLYSILLKILQSQAEHINADPEQKIFIVKNQIAFGVGSRQGQIRYSYLVNVFVDSFVKDAPSADELK